MKDSRCQALPDRPGVAIADDPNIGRDTVCVTGVAGRATAQRVLTRVQLPGCSLRAAIRRCPQLADRAENAGCEYGKINRCRPSKKVSRAMAKQQSTTTTTEVLSPLNDLLTDLESFYKDIHS